MQKVVTLYFKQEFGLIASVRTINKVNNLPTQLDPVRIVRGKVTKLDYKKLILEGFKLAEKFPYIERHQEYRFWEVDGIKSYKTFNKQFSCIKIREKDGVCLVQKLKRIADGGYGLDKGYDFEFSISDLEANIPHIQQLLTDYDVDRSEKLNFKSLEDNLISYQELPDGYEDLGDGHTDAYQMYADSENSKNILAFMIDNGYDSFESKDIESKFIQFWGPLEAYEYTFVDDEQLYARVYALSTQYEIYSYIFKDGDSYLEIQYQLDRIHTSTEQRKKIQADFEELIQSVKVEKA